MDLSGVGVLFDVLEHAFGISFFVRARQKKIKPMHWSSVKPKL
jgi:hypothetical protein